MVLVTCNTFMLNMLQVHGEESLECIVLYYKETAPDLLINHREHYTSRVGRDGVMTAQCKQCNKTLKGKNSIAHMRDHVASHTGKTNDALM